MSALPFLATQLLSMDARPALLGTLVPRNAYNRLRVAGGRTPVRGAGNRNAGTQGWAGFEPSPRRRRAQISMPSASSPCPRPPGQQSENQRLVCLDDLPHTGSAGAPPLLMMQDRGDSRADPGEHRRRARHAPGVGRSADLHRLNESLPTGRDVPEARISEAGRAQLAQALPRDRRTDEGFLGTPALPEFHSGHRRCARSCGMDAASGTGRSDRHILRRNMGLAKNCSISSITRFIVAIV